jgi:hypothetical protein
MNPHRHSDGLTMDEFDRHSDGLTMDEFDRHSDGLTMDEFDRQHAYAMQQGITISVVIRWA